MRIRLSTLVIPLYPPVTKKIALFLLLMVYGYTRAQDSPTLQDVKKEANKYFEADEFTQAYKLYSQLVANYPKDAEYNYRLGVCMIYSEPNKKECLVYLNNANKNPGEAPKDLAFYLGKAYHINYRFDDAIKYYNEFKKTASSSQLKKLQVDREITACNNGKKLLSSLTDVSVQNKKQLDEADYFRTYDLKSIGGKLLVKPDEFKTTADKKRKEKSVMFLPKGGDVVYYSSYGENGANGKDIYTSYKQADGTFSKPELVAGINTPYDEDYPFLHPDGKSLYFASKGHNSMGGYDIFKSVLNEDTKTWSEPVNLEFPVNSPDDDFLFVTDSLEQTAFFSTGRQSPPGKIDVLKIAIDRRPIDVLAIKGKVEPGAEGQSLSSIIKVNYLNSVKTVGNFEADENGDYVMDLPNGADLVFTVETPGLSAQSETVSVPKAVASKPYRQVITYQDTKLKIINYFDENSNDESYLQYMKVIEKKARLDVNVSDTKPEPLAETQTKNPGAVKGPGNKNSNGPQIIEDASIAAANPNGLTNKELAPAVKKDGEAARKESVRLNQDARDANQLAKQEKEAADTKIKEAEQAIIKAETISDETEKTTAIESAQALKREGEQQKVLADKISAYAKSLEEDAGTKYKVAELNTQLSNGLSKSKTTSISSDNKLSELQGQIISNSSSVSASSNYEINLKKEISEKESAIAELEKSFAENQNSNQELKTEIGRLEEQLTKTKKKSAKQTISDQIVDLKSEQSEKEKQLLDGENQIKQLNQELAALNKENELITKIKTETIAPALAPPSGSQIVTSQSLKDKYSESITVTDPTNLSSIEESSKQIKNYTREVDALLAAKKKELPKTKTAKAKQDINSEIKQLEATKRDNQQLLANNTNLTAAANKNTAKLKAEAPVSITLAPLSAGSASEAVVQLDNLTKQLSYNDSPNFEYNAYKDPEAQKLKIEADVKINDAAAQQKQLKENVNASKQEFAAASQPGVDQLENEAEEMMTRSQEKRREAGTKTGAEKTKLLNESKSLETAANEKLLQASDITKQDNISTFSTNQQNIDELIKEKKSPPGDISKSRNLLEAANIAFKQGQAIREEANSLNSPGAKLGNISNAEEKEEEALTKQKEALDLLMISHPGFELKTPVTSAKNASGDTAAVRAKLSGVNNQVGLVLDTKTQSYQKLYAANEIELNQLLNNITANQVTLDNTPSLKSEYIAASSKLDEAKALKQKSDEAADPSLKLTEVINATRKQTAVINQFNNLVNTISLVAMIRPAEPTASASPTPEATSTVEVSASVPEGTVASVQENSAIDYTPVQGNELIKTDTTAKQILSYFDKQNTAIRNEQAYRASKSSIVALKGIESETRNLKEDKLNTEELKTILNQNSSAAELEKIVDGVVAEADQIATQAAEKLREANTKTGTEKENLLQESRELENQALNKRYLASTVNQKAYEIDFKTNAIAISELRKKQSDDNLTLSSELDQVNIDIQNLGSQIQKLKEEAGNLSNRSAKLGALSNVEEKQAQLLSKQKELINGLKKQYPDYVVRPLPKDSVVQMAEAPVDYTAKEAELLNNQYTELTNLTNAFTLEFESSKTLVPETLSVEQLGAKQNADNLNEQSKQLLVEAAQETNPENKIKKLSAAAKLGNAAVEQLNKVLPADAKKFNMKGDDIAALNEIGSTMNSSTNESGGNQTLSIQGLEIIKGNAYSAEKPIPFDAKIDDGLIFRVQIGAFKTQLPSNTFKGLSPVNGETTKNGYFRYTAGNFNEIENANAVKNDLRKLGYRDAFVVAYKNGKRITASEAISLLAQEGKSVDITSPQTAGITENSNLPKAILSEQAAPVNTQDLVQVTKEIDQINGLLYTIQIGVYSKQATKQGLLNLQPIYTKQLPNGLYRYTAGIYNDSIRVNSDRTKVAELGISDAFVSAYLNGSGISFAEAKKRQASDASIKMEEENPIVFPSNTAAPSVIDTNVPATTAAVDPTVQPFTNNVTAYPAPSEENGIKLGEEGVSFKVQIGAFSKQVPNDVAAKFSEIRNWPIENKQMNGLFIYNIGNFSSAKFAKNLKDEAVKLGITDAFITVYRNGKKVYGAEASTLLGQ